VGHQDAGPCEGLAALVANKVSFVGVYPLVLFSASHGEVTTFAVATLKRRLNGVIGEIVGLQFTGCQKAPWALPESMVV